jgi:hypothetical protein
VTKNNRYVLKLNKPIFGFPESHPARRFLEAFLECRSHCVGRELEGIDQEWTRKRDGKRDFFSWFAYRVIAFDIELDNWLQMPPQFTNSERLCLAGISESIADVQECKAAAIADSNHAVVELCDVALNMFQLWIESIEYRRELIARARIDRA